MTTETRFTDPPVREVTLTVLLEPLASLSVLDLATFRTKWTERYPHVEELAPLTPWGGPEDSLSYVAGQSKWPMPSCVMSNETRERQIYFQNDRIGITWTFGIEAPVYPGFDDLHSEIMRAYEDFSAATQSSVSLSPTPKRISVRYTNEITGVRPDELALGLLNGWPLPDPRGQVAPGFTSLRIHHCPTDENSNVSLLMVVDPDEDDEGEHTDVTDSCLFRIGGDADLMESESVGDAMVRVHDVVLRRFISSTSAEIQAKWGRLT